MLTQEEIRGNWSQLSGKIKEVWGVVTDQELKQVQGNVDQLVGLIQRKTGQSRQEIEQRLGEFGEAASSMAHQATEKIRDTAENVRARAMDTYSTAEHMIRERPTESLAVAFGTGLIAGIIVGLLSRSR